VECAARPHPDGPRTLRFEVAGPASPSSVQLPDGAIATRWRWPGTDPARPPRLGIVEPGRPAIRAGLKPGDLLVRANGDTLRSWSEVLHMVWNRAPQAVKLTCLRRWTVVSVTVVPESKVETGHRVAPDTTCNGASARPTARFTCGALGPARSVSGYFWLPGDLGPDPGGPDSSKASCCARPSFSGVGGIITVGQIRGRCRAWPRLLLTFVAFF